MAIQTEHIERLANSIVAEIPASRIGDFLKKLPNAAKDGNCGAGCGEGCCGAACATADGLSIDHFGHSGFDATTLNAIGKSHLDQLKESIRSGLAQRANTL